MWFFLCVCLPPATGGKEHLDQDDDIHDNDDDEIHPDGDRPRSWVFHHCKCWSAGKQNLRVGIVLTIADGIGITSKIFIIVGIIISSPTTSTSPLSFSLWSPSDHHHLQKRPKQSPRQLSQHSQDVKSQRNPRDVAVDDCEWWPKNQHYPPPDHHHHPDHLFLWLSSCSLDSRRRHAGTVAKLKDNTYSDDDIWGFVLSTLLMTDNADDRMMMTTTTSRLTWAPLLNRYQEAPRKQAPQVPQCATPSHLLYEQFSWPRIHWREAAGTVWIHLFEFIWKRNHGRESRKISTNVEIPWRQR